MYYRCRMPLLAALLVAAAAQAPQEPAAAPAVRAPAKKIAVLDVRASAGLDAALAQFLTQVLAGEVAARTGVHPLVSADIKALLGFEKTRQAFGCDEESAACVAEIAGALGADEVVSTQLGASEAKAGRPERYLLSCSRIDAHKASPLGRDAQSVAYGDDAALEQAVRRAAFRLFGGADPGEVHGEAAQKPAAPVESVSARGPLGHRPITWAAGSATAAFAAGAGVLGLSALSSASSGDTSARSKAHLADGLWVAAALSAGLTIWLWRGD
jgi:hypothetical protein